MKIYLASPLGFAAGLKTYLEAIRTKLRDLGHEVLCPWETDWSKEIGSVVGSQVGEGWYRSEDEKQRAINLLAAQIGEHNRDRIKQSDVVLGVLDGPEVDSGTASEMGYASGRGKVCYGIRTDFRNCGDLPGLPFNLQVLYWITRRNGKLFRSIDEIKL